MLNFTNEGPVPRSRRRPGVPRTASLRRTVARVIRVCCGNRTNVLVVRGCHRLAVVNLRCVVRCSLQFQDSDYSCRSYFRAAAVQARFTPLTPVLLRRN